MLDGAGSTLDVTEAQLHQFDALLRHHAQRWMHTPYRFGGTSEHGVDCSGLIQRVYADALGVSLPRTTSQQIHAGRRIGPGSAVPGDLVFFEPKGKSRHAGIVLGQQQFLHASSSRGVMISPLNEGYWSHHIAAVRRVVTAEELLLVLSRSEPKDSGVPDLTRH